MVLNQTPFYGESGGQVGDTGIITGADGLRIAVTDTQKKLGDLFVHLGRVEAGTARPGRRRWSPTSITRGARAIRAHHSATHLLHEALRRRLGTHVAQKGSLNAPDRLRFDVSQPRPITASELAWVEAEVNARIRENSEVDDPADDPGRRGGARAPWRCSARNTARRCASLRWARARATASPGRSSCAAARMCAAPAISAISASSRKPRSPPACAGSRR